MKGTDRLYIIAVAIVVSAASNYVAFKAVDFIREIRNKYDNNQRYEDFHERMHDDIKCLHGRVRSIEKALSRHSIHV